MIITIAFLISYLAGMLILLDIDGVMVPASNWKAPELLSDGFPGFSFKAVNALNKIITATASLILLTTSHKSVFSIEEWNRIFTRRGIQASISSLPEAAPSQHRINEILTWHQENLAVQNFVIIDDDKSLNSLQTLLKNKLVLTSSLIGLTDDLADKAIEILKAPLLMPV